MEIVLGIVAVVIVLFVFTGKSRRANKMKEEIYALVRSGRSKTILHDIFFEAALKFALEHGGKLEHGQSAIYTNSIIFRMNIDGTNYLVYFSKNSDGSTYIGIDDADEMQKEFRERIGQTHSVQANEKAESTEQKPLYALLVPSASTAINTLIDNSTLAKQFVLEELDAARQGDPEAVNFVENSGFSSSEYIGAMGKTNWGDEENILENIQIQFRLLQSQVAPDDRAKFSIAVVDDVMKHWELGKYSHKKSDKFRKKFDLKAHIQLAPILAKIMDAQQDEEETESVMYELSKLTESTLEELFEQGGLEKLIQEFNENQEQLNEFRLIDVVEKTDKQRDSGFTCMMDDLLDSSDLVMSHSLAMAHAYALRTVAAGLFLQGIFDREAYDETSNMFKGMQLHTGQTVEFQEAAAKEAYEFFASYDSRLTKEVIIVMTSMVERDKASALYTGNGKKIPYETVLAGIQTLAADLKL